MATSQRYKVHQIKHLLLADSWWLRVNDLDDDNVLVYEGDLTLDTLSLNFEEDVPSADLITLILVRGNLTVTGNIHSGDDGSVSLTVLGNLHARNMSIGGQELYVQGDIHVEEIFYGSYNHGETLALGSIHALVYIHDDEYRVQAAGGTDFTYRILSRDGYGFWKDIPLLASEVIRPELLDEGCDDGDPYVYIQAHDLTINGSILQDVDRLRKGLPAPQIAPLVSSPAISPEAIATLAQSALMPLDGDRSFQYKEGDVTWRVSAAGIDEDGDRRPNSVFFQDATAQYFLYFTEKNEFVCLYKKLNEGSGEWISVTDMRSPEAQRVYNYWVNLLAGVTVAQHYSSLIPKAELESFFEQSLEWKKEWWFGDLRFRLWHPRTTAEGKQTVPMLHIQTPGDAPSLYKYFILAKNWIECDVQEHGASESLTIPFSNVRLQEIAARYYKVFQMYMRLRLAEDEE
jgi:hypothetical protein